MAYHASVFFSRELKIANAQIALAERQHPRFQAPKDLSKQVFSHIGECFAEALLFNKIFKLNSFPDRILDHPAEIPGFEYIGFEHIKRLVNDKRSVVALSAHTGPIEILAAYLVQCGIPLFAIGKRPNYPAIAQFLDEFRRSYGTNIVWREDKQSARTILKALKNGGVVGALIDQDTALENEFAPSFGVDAAFPIGAIKLAIQYKTPILSTFVVRRRRLNYTVISRPIEYEPNSPSAIREILEEYSRQLDELIIHYPDQWVWWHRRWRRRPGIDYKNTPEKLRSTKDYVNWINSIT